MDLFPYQREGAAWLAVRPSALMGDKMGLGKTVQAIRACDIAGARRVAVACPAVARMNWRREFERWSVFCPELKIASYNALADSRPLRQEWAAWRPDVLIADEAHYLKTPDTRRTKSIYGPWCMNDGIASCAGSYWALSGTMTPNNVTELYPHLKARFPQVLPGDKSMHAFLKRYTKWSAGTYGVTIHSLLQDNLPELREALRPHMLRRTVEQVLPDLPPFVLGELVVEAEAATAELLLLERSIEVQALLARLDAGMAAPDADPQIATYRRITGEAKARPVARMIADELSSGQMHKVVLFAHHRTVIAILEAALAEFGAVSLHGGTPDKVRNANIDRFQSDFECQVFIGQLQAASTAITLTAAHHCVLVESSWVPAENEQACYRLRRIGTRSAVQIRMAALSNSIDEAIQTVLARKTRALLDLYES